MNELTYDKLITDRAKGIRSLVKNAVVRKYFRKQLKAFDKDCLIRHEKNENYKKEVSELREFIFGGKVPKELSEQIEKKEQFQKKLEEIQKPPPDPFEILSLPTNDVSKNRIMGLFYPHDKRRCSQNQIVRGCYALLAILHDSKYATNTRVIPISDGIWSDEVNGWTWLIGQQIANVWKERGESERKLLKPIHEWYKENKKPELTSKEIIDEIDDARVSVRDDLISKKLISEQEMKLLEVSFADKSTTTEQEANDDAGDDEYLEGVLSKPMPKSRMMSALNIDSYETFNSFADRYGIEKINRKTYQIRLDKMDARTREKLEKA
ncbi:MAG: hypothetical protein V3W45_07080 [Sedimentisphaerales bacterium]